MLAALARLVTGNPRRVLVATFVMFLVAAGVGAPVTGLLSVDPDLDFIDPQAREQRHRQAAARRRSAAA